MAKLVEPKPITVGDLHHDRVAVGGLPALAAGLPGALNFHVGVLEQRVELFACVGTFGRTAVVCLDMGSGIPVEEHLSRVGAEVLLTDSVPAIVRVADVAIERTQRGVVAAQRRVRDVFDRTQIGRELLDHRRRPVPRVLVDVIDEAVHVAQTLLDGGELQVA
ncbi:hypothetical protein [Arthrobacter sp. A5]|uniref:hypothetical protein n=1 Tax=Arthrobacter sp. A5 TaxID=576926 RepID=UPI003DAA206B